MGSSQFNRERNGSLWDRGNADAYHGRDASPHWYRQATYVGSAVTNLSKDEVAEYMDGYNAYIMVDILDCRCYNTFISN